ncbi:MAG: hypothetical protein LAP21_17275 [Acidobacteriia bacterium]|nr:hypothetical protein [Terriglobia bacterium]
MGNPIMDETPSVAQTASPELYRLVCQCCAVLLFLMTVFPTISRAHAQQQTKPPVSNPVPEPAISAILAAFDKYEVVGMGEAHGDKDKDDLILLLIRNPAFAEEVNDIAVECGNSLYQPILDRYIAGDDVPFTEVRKVWRNTTQQMCARSGFFEQFFPLVRAINQKLPPAKRLRVLAGDPPIDWDQIKDYERKWKFDREASIASVMEKEVLSRHRKALMLFGEFHLMHGQEKSAVSIYERDYPNRTFVIAELGSFDTDLPALSSSPFATWPFPSIARARGTWLGAMDLDQFYPKQVYIDNDCNMRTVEYPKSMQKPMEDMFDAFLYLGPQDLRLKEKAPADIALDIDYMMELERRQALPGPPRVTAEALKESERQIVKSAEHPLLIVPGNIKSMMKGEVQNCLDRKKSRSAPQ